MSILKLFFGGYIRKVFNGKPIYLSIVLSCTIHDQEEHEKAHIFIYS